jgi:mono/diheme cytochrome c family protein
MKRTLLTIVSALIALAAMAAVIVGTGAYNVAADEPHTALVFGVLEAARERSIAVRADDIDVPPLDDRAMVRRGAGNYDAMCVGCHLAPGKENSELRTGLYPVPPDLTKHTRLNPAETFWVIKHGVKSTGMPAWGKSMDDRYIWDLVAFVRALPSLSAKQYAAEVEGSEGHSHGGGESGGHSDGEGTDHDEQSKDENSHHGSDAESPSESHDHSDTESSAGTTHSHTDGTEHLHEEKERARRQ